MLVGQEASVRAKEGEFLISKNLVSMAGILFTRRNHFGLSSLRFDVPHLFLYVALDCSPPEAGFLTAQGEALYSQTR